MTDTDEDDLINETPVSSRPSVLAQKSTSTADNVQQQQTPRTSAAHPKPSPDVDDQSAGALSKSKRRRLKKKHQQNQHQLTENKENVLDGGADADEVGEVAEANS